MIETTKQAHQVASYVDQNIDAIVNALNNQASHMEEAAKQAREAYEAGQAHPEVRAVQDASIMTNNGLKHSATLFEQDAANAREIVETLAQLIDGDDEDRA